MIPHYQRPPSVMDKFLQGIETGAQRGHEFSKMALEHGLKAKAKAGETADKLASLENLKKTDFWKNSSDFEKAIIEGETRGNLSAQSAKSLINLYREKEDRSAIDKYLEENESTEGKQILKGLEEEDEISTKKGKSTEKKAKTKFAPKLSDLALADIASGSGRESKWAQSIQDLRKEERARAFTTEQGELKQQQRHDEQLRAETAPIRKEYADKARNALAGIENKKRLLDVIETGNIDDPTYAIIAQAIPFRLGERLLSPESLVYRAGMIDEFKDLRSIFQGQTRIKEIDLLEDKMAALYLTDEQKKAILSSRLEALRADVIRGEVAAELEAEGNFGGLAQFQKKVEEKAAPRIEALFNRILDQQKSVIQDAENFKKIPLDSNDPEGLIIMKQIRNEAGGDIQKAKELAKKQGYSWAGMK